MTSLGNEKATQKCPFDGFVTMYLTLLILETCLFFYHFDQASWKAMFLVTKYSDLVSSQRRLKSGFFLLSRKRGNYWYVPLVNHLNHTLHFFFLRTSLNFFWGGGESGNFWLLSVQGVSQSLYYKHWLCTKTKVWKESHLNKDSLKKKEVKKWSSLKLSTLFMYLIPCIFCVFFSNVRVKHCT